MKTRIVGLVACLLLFAGVAHAQVVCQTPTSCTVTVAMTPTIATIAWDPDVDTTDVTITGYAIYDGTTRVVTVPASATQTPVSLNTFATHVLTVTALGVATLGGASLESSKSISVSVLVQQSQGQTAPPLAPQNVRIVANAPACATTSPYGTTAATVTDGSCHVFTLNGAQTMRDGVFVANGSGSLYTFVPSGVYVLGTDAVWYHFDVATDGTFAWAPRSVTKPIV